MKYPCNLIQDLMPLYMDGVCSDESRKIVEQHIAGCSVCKEYYTAMSSMDELVVSPSNAEQERKKAASIQAVKKKLLQRQVLTAASVILVLVVLTAAVCGVLKNSLEVVEYKDNISVSMVDGSLVGRLQGSQESYVRVKRVTMEVDGQEEAYLFFYVSNTKWDDFTTSSKVFSEYTLCPADKGADLIDKVYYYTGDYTDIEIMDSRQLQEIIEHSGLLWSK